MTLNIMAVLSVAIVLTYWESPADQFYGDRISPSRQESMFIETALMSRDTFVLRQLKDMLSPVRAEALTNWLTAAQENRINAIATQDGRTKVRDVCQDILSDIRRKREQQLFVQIPAPKNSSVVSVEEDDFDSFSVDGYEFNAWNGYVGESEKLNLANIPIETKQRIRDKAARRAQQNHALQSQFQLDVAAPRDVLNEYEMRTGHKSGAVAFRGDPDNVYIISVGENIPVPIHNGQIDEDALRNAKKNAKRILHYNRY